MKRPLISFIIPVLNEADVIERALQALRPWRSLAELIVVDGGSADDCVARARPLCDQLVQAPRGRALQMNAGSRAARGEYLFFLHCDTRLTIGIDKLQRVLAEHPRWGYFKVCLSGGDWLLRTISFFMNLRSALSRIATGDQVLFIQAELFENLGGYAEIPLMEDVEICARLRSLYRPRRIGSPVVTSSRRWEERGVVRTVITMWRLRLAYWLGTSPERLAQIYHG